MRDINTMTLVGRLGRDPQTRQAGNATLTEFSLANQLGDKTNWINVKTWNKTAEFCNKYLHKGSKICVSGRYVAETNVGKDGKTYYSVFINANEIELFGENKISDEEIRNTPVTATLTEESFESDDFPF